MSTSSEVVVDARGNTLREQRDELRIEDDRKYLDGATLPYTPLREHPGPERLLKYVPERE
jgi:hypothetical protein